MRVRVCTSMCVSTITTFWLALEKINNVVSPGNCIKALPSTVAALLFSCCGEYQNPSTSPCTTQRLETSPDQYQRPSATRHASQRRELQTTDTGQASNYESKINTRNHRHLLTPLDEWSLQVTGTNQKPNHHAMINLHHRLTRLIMHDINGLWDHMWCEEMLVTSNIHHSKRE